jgi:Ca2+-binding EF-hand superfamily protein
MIEILMNLEVSEDPDEVPFKEVQDKALELLASERWTPDSSSTLMQAFQAIDKERKGTIPVGNITKILKTGDSFFEQEIDEFVKVAKDAASDDIYYEDYVSLMSSYLNASSRVEI